MWKTLVPILLQFTQPSWVLGDGTYECGDHGRFEYCIDEIPGCVIGCHCHPGYYFDTDTKICELNSKLIELHRRHSVIKPTQTQVNHVTSSLLFNPETATSTDKIDGNVDEIAKDANDLGDWLYNQFFKTIENQVINNTNDKDVLNRRSGSQQPVKKPKSSKKWRKRGKSSKQKGKREQLRRKLLRITENDSLFDLSSKSSSDSSDSSSSSDLSSMEYEIDEDNHRKHDDDEHGHKKIVMINKKPKQPLPSFIFLPNLDTPFYPPIGLHPPPIVPMYPMVPVPPVPLCPISGCDENVNKQHSATTSSASTTTARATNTTITIVSTSVQSSLPETTSAIALTTGDDKTTELPNADTKALRLKNKNKKKKAARLSNMMERDGRDTGEGIGRQKIFQRLKEKMNNPSADLIIPSWQKNKQLFANKLTNQNADTKTAFLDNGIVNDEYLNNEINPHPLEDDMFPDNVDFKYITELIHRVDLNNKSNVLPPIEYNPLDNMELNRMPKIHRNKVSDYNIPFDTPENRRSNRPMYHKPDESYYANLGRQIATMIRGIDTHPKNVELAEKPGVVKNDPYLNNSPTSFWERSVRSPLSYFKTKNKKYEYLKGSNELLFDIENKVEIIASTASALTLREIENIVKIMEAAKKQIQRTNKPKKGDSRTSNKNLNIDLWPQKSQNHKDSVLSYLNKVKQENIENHYKTNNNMSTKPNSNFPGVHLESIQKFVAWNNGNLKQTNQIHSMPTTAKPSINKSYSKITPTTYNFGKSNTIHQIPARSSPFLQNQQYPYFLRDRKYFPDNYNSNINYNEVLPRLEPVVRIVPIQPSYF
ncbi:uncharacterized protein LOC120631024 [Pararge aegeria]|uniref:uncharacterized protein LOC120631024 n=1 Tax=Pararge aegeria TaxID=116150 RepID=UPI0019D1A5E5|nr:uncharacterized protein LOC120631024 [Pararge aegeria]